MPMTLYLILAITAFACAVASYWRPPALTVAVLLLSIVEMMRAFPGGHS